MKLFLPNSAHLQNIEGFIRKYQPNGPDLNFGMHPKWVHMHPAALAMAACAGQLCARDDGKIDGKIHQVRSLPYLIRMGLFDFINIDPGKEITEKEASGRFVPLTQISSSKELRKAIVDLVPLLHAPPQVADPIKYVFSEMVRNVLEHAASPVGAIVAAQYYRNLERLSIGIADAGVGIKKSMSRSHPARTAREAITLALRPGISGATNRIGGNEQNAGAGLFFTKSIASLSRNFFIIFSGDSLFKLLRGSSDDEPEINADPTEDHHHFSEGLPEWRGTVVGIDISVDTSVEFSDLLAEINKAYSIDVKKSKKAYYKRIQFE